MSLNIAISQALTLAPPLELPLKLRLPQGRFGARRSVSNSPAGRFHTGVDLHAAIGDSVFPAYGGIVVVSEQPGTDRKVGDGFVRIWHQIAADSGYISTYSHLDTVNVRVNQFVEVGELIGTVGVPEDKSWEPHLHFELRHVAADGITGLSAADRNDELRKMSRSVAVDPTRPFYHWDLESYSNGDSDRIVSGNTHITQIADITHQHIRYFRVKLASVRDYLFIPLYSPSPDETSIIETIRAAYFAGNKVNLTYRQSPFWENKLIIAEARA